MRLIPRCCVVLAVALAVGCGGGDGGDKGKGPAGGDGGFQGGAQPGGGAGDTAEGLKKVFEDLLAATRAGDQAKVTAMAKNLMLPNPDASFKRLFGDGPGGAVAAQYQRDAAKLEGGLFKEMQLRLKRNQTQVQVDRIEQPNDPKANGNQKRALERMQMKVPLYSVRMVAPGERLGFHMYSFAHVDGGFRWLGRMDALK
jgi:hypothetical protein